MKLKIQARAKINWTLDVVGTLPNGYHDLDMLMQSVTLCDQMTMEEAPQLTLYVRAQGRSFVPADGNNLVLKAAAALQAATGCTRGARITLKKYIEKKARLSVREALSIAIQACMGIEAAHNNHIIHRDIKPQNIIISKDGKVKVTDFGIAKAATSNTITSNVMGSVHYTSPEQARGGYSDEKSDIYSMGITLFEMLTDAFHSTVRRRLRLRSSIFRKKCRHRENMCRKFRSAWNRLF